MQLQRDVAGRMRQVETHERPGRMPRLGDGLQVEGLSGVEVHPAEQHQGQFIAQLRDARLDVLRAQRVFSFPGAHLHQVLFRIAAVEGDLGGHGVGVAREGPFLAEDLPPPALGTVERDQEQVQVRGEAVHGHHLLGLRAHDAGQAFAEELVVRIPGTACLEMAFDPVLRPILQFLLKDHGRPFRLQAKRVAGEVEHVPPFMLGEEEFPAEVAQGIGGIGFAGVGFGGLHGSAKSRCPYRAVPEGRQPSRSPSAKSRGTSNRVPSRSTL